MTSIYRQRNPNEFTDKTNALVALAGTRNFIVVRDGFGPPPVLSGCILAKNAATNLNVLSFQIELSTGCFRQYSICLTGENQAGQESLVQFADNAGHKVWSGPVSDCPAINEELAGQVLTGLSRSQRFALLRFLLEKCALRLPVNGDPGYSSFCRTMLRYSDVPISPQPIWAKIGSGFIYGSARSLDQIDQYASAVIIQPDCIQRVGHKTDVIPFDGKASVDIVLENQSISGRKGSIRQIVLFADNQCLAIPLDPRADFSTKNIFRHLDNSSLSEKQARVDFLYRTLKTHAQSTPEIAALIKEISLTHSRPERTVEVTDNSLGGGIELAVAVPDGGLFTAGWVLDNHDLVTGFDVHSPFGANLSMGDNICYFPARRDLKSSAGEGDRTANRRRFVAFTDKIKDPAGAVQYQYDLLLKSGASTYMVAPKSPISPITARQKILQSVPAADLDNNMLEACLAPALAGFEQSCRSLQMIDRIIDLNAGIAMSRRSGPRRSIIIPLYKNLSFLRFQIAALAMDRSSASAEIVFVLDSPWQAREVEQILRGLSELYAMSMRLVIMADNFGFSASCNAGAEVASGRDLMFLNSDVVPITQGWLQKMSALRGKQKNTGAVGPKLLFDDHSLQHAGLVFKEDPAMGWYNDHYFKGFPGDYPGANRSRRVPGVTGACLLIDKQLFEKIDGFDDGFVHGDFEDSDLCLKLHREERENWYCAEAELFHFERQSIANKPDYTQSVANQYNRWRHEQRWSAVMPEIMRAASGW